MTEKQKQIILENSKELFRKSILPVNLNFFNHLKLKDFDVDPLMFLAVGLSPKSMAKALVYPKVLELCVSSGIGSDDFLWQISRVSQRISINEHQFLEFVDAIDGRKKYAWCTFSRMLSRHDMNRLLCCFKDILKERSQNDPAFLIDDLVVGVLFGDPIKLSAEFRTLQTTYPVYCGREFWEHITGDKLFYKRLMKAFFDVVEEEQTEGSDLIRQKVKEIAQEIEEI